MKLALLLIPLLFLITSCTVEEIESIFGESFFLLIIYVFVGTNLLLRIFYPKFWGRSRKGQKYPDGFYKDFRIIFPSFGGKIFDVFDIKLSKQPIGCEAMSGTLEFMTNKSVHIGTITLLLDTNNESMNTWIELDDEGETLGLTLEIKIDKDYHPGIPQYIPFEWNILERLDTNNENVKESFECYKESDDIDIANERDDIKKWFENPEFDLVALYKGKEIYRKAFTIKDSAVQEYIQTI